MRKYILSLIGVIVSFGFAFAQESAKEEITASALTPQLSLELTGQPTFLYSFPIGSESWDTGYIGTMKIPRLQNDIGLAVEYGQIKGVFDWSIKTSDDGISVLNQENYLAWNPDFFRFGFGYQIYSWGVSDGRNPTDNLNPKDYTTVEGAKLHKLPVLSLGATWYPTEEISLDVVFVPLPSESLFPLDYVDSLHAHLGLPVVFTGPGAKPENFIAGGKFNYRSSLLDTSISYLYDFDPMYTPAIANDFSITLERKRLHRFGIDAKTTIDRFGLWAETCYSLSGNQDSSNYTERLSRLDYTVGLDFNYGPGDNFYLNIQYTGTVIPGFDSSANIYAPSDKRYLEKALLYSLGGINEGMLQGITWNARWNLADSLILPSISGSYSMPFNYDDSTETRYGSLLIKPEIDIMPIDSLHIAVGAILAYAWVQVKGHEVTLDTASDAGVYTVQNHLYLSVSYKWNYSLNK